MTAKPAEERGPRLCFVIMPFSSTTGTTEDEWTSIFENLIKPAVEEADLGYRCLRSRATRGNIVGQIMESLRDAHVVIADLTDQNPNVFYELGVRHALEDRTILIAQSRDFIPFDLRPYANHIYDRTTPNGVEEFKATLKELLTDVDRSPDRPDNPVSDFLKGRSGQVQPAPEPALSAADAPFAQPLAGPGAQGLDVAQLASRITASRNLGGMRTVIRLTRAHLATTWPERIQNLNAEASAGETIAQAEIYEFSLGIVGQFASDIFAIEEFGLQIVEDEFYDGLRELLRLVEDWIALSERVWPGTSRRPVTGAPGLLALRVLCAWGAKAIDNLSVTSIRILASSPIATLESTGRPSTLPFVERKDLFWPKAMLEYADLGTNYIRDEPWKNPGVKRFFATESDFLAGLAGFLFTIGIVYGARHPQADWPLYPGFKLIPGASDSIQHFLAKIATDEQRLGDLAAMIPEDVRTFRAEWPNRVRALNDAKLGQRHDLFNRWLPVPEDLDALLTPSD